MTGVYKFVAFRLTLQIKENLVNKGEKRQNSFCVSADSVKDDPAMDKLYGMQ
jgi:hypothetical protein